MFTNSFKTAAMGWRMSIWQGMMSSMMPISQIPRRRRQLSYKKLRGMTLVELMVTVSIAGVLATAATVSFREQVNKSHSVEAVAMLGTMQKAVSIAGIDAVNVDSDLNFTRTTFGKGNGKGNSGSSSGSGNGNKTPDSEIDPNDIELSGSKSNNGHGNNEGGCDPSNPGNGGKCSGDPSSGDSGSSGSGNDNSSDNGKGNGKGSNKDGGIDGDGNNGHGNNEDGCDPDNPGNGGKCNKNDDSDETSDDGSGSDGASDGSGSDGDGTSTDDGGSGDGASNDGSDDGADGSGSDDSGSSDSGGPGGGSDGIDSLCGSADPVPSSIDMVRGKTYNAPPSSWSSGSSTSGWSCLRVSRSGNQRYQFGYDKGAGSTSGADEGFTAWARGDLDGDGRTSLFRIRGDLINGSVVHGPAVEIIDGNE